MRAHSGLGLAALVVLSGGCLQILGYQDTTVIDPGTGGGGGSSAHCSNGKKDGDEVGVDCGGSCAKCEPGMGCANGADCTSLVCGPGGTCLAPACDDKVKNGDESDSDCGGAACGKCAAGDKCVTETDCVSGACANEICSATCSDGMKNGAETGLDCGGGCPGCKDGEACAVSADCGSGVCQAKACVSSYVWAKRFGDVQNQVGTVVVSDKFGQSFVLGQAQGAVDFGGGPLTSSTFIALTLAKFDASGNHLWSKLFNKGTFTTHATGIAIDDSGGCTLTAEAGAVSFGGVPLNPGIVAAGFNGSGDLIWNLGFGHGFQPKIATIDQDRVVIATSTQETLDFGGGPLTSVGGEDVVIAKLTYGIHLWSKRFGDADDQLLKDVAVDTANDIIAVGEFGGSLDFGNGPITSVTGSDLFVAKLTTLGEPSWSTRFGGTGTRTVSAVATDSSNNIVTIGTFNGTLDFGGDTLTGASSIFMTKLDASGVHVWSKNFSQTGLSTQLSVAMTIDNINNIALTGGYSGSIDFGGGELTSVGTSSTFVAMFDPSGKHIWSKSFGKDQSGSSGSSITMHGTGKTLILTGAFDGQVDFGGGPLTSAGQLDVFLTKLLIP